jgi:hypothetical protein
MKTRTQMQKKKQRSTGPFPFPSNAENQCKTREESFVIHPRKQMDGRMDIADPGRPMLSSSLFVWCMIQCGTLVQSPPFPAHTQSLKRTCEGSVAHQAFPFFLMLHARPIHVFDAVHLIVTLWLDAVTVET